VNPDVVTEPRVDSAPDPTPDAATVSLRLATWNLNHWRQPMLPVDTRRAAWGHLAKAMSVQVALVQEAVPPLEFERERVVYGELAGHRNWGSAVVALDRAIAIEPLRSVRIPWSRRRYLLENANPGSVAIARMTVPGIEPITLVSVYGVFDGPVVSSVLRVVADLMPLFDSPYGARVILGGDLNVSRSTSDPKQRARADAILAAILSLGLVEAKTLATGPPLAAALDRGQRGLGSPEGAPLTTRTEARGKLRARRTAEGPPCCHEGPSNIGAVRGDLRRDGHPSGGRDDTQLDQHAELLDQAPVLDDPPIGDPPDVDLGPRCALAGGGHARKVARHRAARRLALHEPVAFFDRVIDRVVDVGESCPQRRGELLEAFARRRLAGLRRAVDVVAGEELVDELVLALVEDLERDALELGLEFGCHRESDLSLASTLPCRVAQG